MNGFKKDLERYGGFRSFFREQSLYCVFVYRIGEYIENLEYPLLKAIYKIPYYILFRFVETVFSTSIPKEAKIGAGLRIWHFGQIFINSDVVIGVNCTLRQGVTIGSKVPGGGSPIIGDNVDIGANSMIIGDIKIGSNSVIGAMTLVNKDVPEGSVVVGIPGRIINKDLK